MVNLQKIRLLFNTLCDIPYEKLVEDQIITWTNEGDIVYDPFMGSGTTAKVASLTNRNWIGSELSKEYVTITLERLKENNIEVDD